MFTSQKLLSKSGQKKPQNLKREKIDFLSKYIFSQATNYTNHLSDNSEGEKAFIVRETRVPYDAFLELQWTDLPAHSFSLN